MAGTGFTRSGSKGGGIVSLASDSVSVNVVPQTICSPLLNTCVNVTKVFSPTLVLHTPHKYGPKAIFPTLTHISGNTYVLLLIDTFTRVEELYPRTDVTAVTACDALMF